MSSAYGGSWPGGVYVVRIASAASMPAGLRMPRCRSIRATRSPLELEAGEPCEVDPWDRAGVQPSHRRATQVVVVVDPRLRHGVSLPLMPRSLPSCKLRRCRRWSRPAGQYRRKSRQRMNACSSSCVCQISCPGTRRRLEFIQPVVSTLRGASWQANSRAGSWSVSWAARMTTSFSLCSTWRQLSPTRARRVHRCPSP
jgi:hypothetical protein